MNSKNTKIGFYKKFFWGVIILHLFILFENVEAKERVIYRAFSSHIVMSEADIKAEIRYNVYSNLISFKGYENIIPDLAYGWKVNENRTVYDFYIRKNIYFHDGSLLKLNDIKESLERSFKKKVQYYLNKDLVVGLRDFLNGKVKHIKGIKCLNGEILRIKLNKPYSYFLKMLAIYDFSIYKNVKGRKVGTGPYILQKEVKNNGLYVKAVLVKNKKYYLPLNLPDKIILFDIDKINYTPDIFSVISYEAEPYVRRFKQYKKYKAYNIFMQTIIFNFKSYWGKNRDFRNFIGYGFDFRKVVERTYKYFEPVHNIIPSSLPHYNCVPSFPSHDYNKAIEHLNKIKNRKKEVNILLFKGLKRKLIYKALKNFLEKHGFKVKKREYDPIMEKYTKSLFANSDIIIVGIVDNESVFSPSFFIYNSLNTKGVDNLITYRNLYIEELSRALVKDKVKDIWKAMNFIINILDKDMPFIPIANSYIIYFVDKKVSFSSPPLMRYIDYRYVRINDE